MVELELALQLARQEAYLDGEYELDEEEGFHCEECGWCSLTAPMNDRASDGIDTALVECGNCGEPDPTSHVTTDWNRVEEKLPDEYLDQ